jgi:hypothetical protein
LEEAKFVFGDSFAWPCSRVTVGVGLSFLAMGDKCAVEYAQCAQVSLLLQDGVAKVDELDAAWPISRGLLQVGAIVGDLVVLEQVLRTDLAVTGSEPAPGSICEKGV